jgi:Zn-dependent peptidase ImmA (M78 family)
MISLLPKLEEYFPFLGQRAVTENDLQWLCFRDGVEVVFRDDIPKGVYAMSGGEHFILLNTKLFGWSLLYVFAHEFAHYLFHAPSNSSFHLEFFASESKQKNHMEAESVAALLLLPLCEIEELIETGLYNSSEELSELMKTRLRILDTYRF